MCGKASSRAFAESEEMFYDLTQENPDFDEWIQKFPFDACRYCKRGTAPHEFLMRVL